MTAGRSSGRGGNRHGRGLLRAAVAAALLVALSADVAVAVSARAVARSPEDRRDAIVHDVTIEAKDLLLQAIHLGQRILVAASKRYAGLTEGGPSGTRLVEVSVSSAS